MDLTTEAVVIRPPFRELFTEEELAVASSRVVGGVRATLLRSRLLVGEGDDKYGLGREDTQALAEAGC
ncbi:hypothetical protein OG767_06580 [Micromonospora sp. NBC_01392]|uniref:hypothetical protein n=1 Tax=Micromonospora sp. NBC_01392 TaxID=2903588 RepID=UPI00325383F1